MTDPSTPHEHAGGVAWREWNDETFRLARELDRPILLDISAVWCHWCHVMDRTSYADPAVIALLDRRFIAVRVDNDRRPDINERYNMGGWPTTAFLTPTGEVLTGATYIPPDQLRRTLAQVADYYEHNKQDIYEKLSQTRSAAPEPRSAGLDEECVGKVLEAVHAAVDPTYGGFGSEPKFPHPDAVDLLLRDYGRTGAERARSAVLTTLDQMAAGGLYDSVEGGFFRYSTTRDWRIPHFEKMLEGNAGLLANYVHACQATGEKRYAETARDIMRYVNTVLSDRDAGGFYGSQDADEEYYALPLEKRRERRAPFVDTTLYTDWNALMASAYLTATAALADDAPQGFALQTLDQVWRLNYRPGQGVFHYYDGQSQVSGLLTDQVHMGLALVDAFQATGDKRWLERATALAGFCRQSLGAPGGGFFDTTERPDAPGTLKQRLTPLLGNATAARFFLRLYWLLDEETYREIAEGALARFTDLYERFDYFAAPYALAVDEATRPPLKVVIVGDATDQHAQALRAAARRLPEAWKVVHTIDPERDPAGFARSGFPRSATPLAYPCVGNTCLAPLDDPAQLAAWRPTTSSSLTVVQSDAIRSKTP